MNDDCDLKTLSERRKGKRFKAREGAFAVLYDGTNRVGPVVDLSKKGLSFRYIDDGKKVDRATQLAIIVKGQGFYLRMIPACTVYDIEETPKVPFSAIKMRKRGVKFGRLTNYQVALLRYFLRNFTVHDF